MGLAAAQVRLLGLTARKADCEYEISINAMHKMSLTREMTDLTSEYNAKLQAKNIAYYANGKYNKINYQYLMGGDSINWWQFKQGSTALKKDNSMILTDYMGQVVMSENYATAITSVLGASAMNAKGQGGTFSQDKIPAILAALMHGVEVEEVEAVMNGGDLNYSYSATQVNAITGQKTGSTVVDASATLREYIQSAIDFYLPILQAAANSGWTTEYNTAMATNPDYVSDALVSGSFQLETVDEYGDYEAGSSLDYFLTNGTIETNTSSEAREDITAWYDAEKARISEKETWLDVENQNLSTELEAINTEIQSVQSFIDDAIKVFDWGSA